MASVSEILVNGVLTPVTMFDHSAQEIDDTVDGHKKLQEDFDDFKENGELTPTAHAATHAVGGGDPITPALIGAYSKDETYNKEEVERLASAGGGLLPQIIVTAPTGSTVTCVKEDITLTVEEAEGTWTFDVPEYGEWSVYVNGNLDSQFYVDTVKQYCKEYTQLVNYVMLYDSDLGEGGASGGNACVDVTGGWVATGSTYGTVSYNDTGISRTTGDSGGLSQVFPTNTVNFSEYNGVAAKVSGTLKQGNRNPLENLDNNSLFIGGLYDNFYYEFVAYKIYSSQLGDFDTFVFMPYSGGTSQIVGLSMASAGKSTFTLTYACAVKEDDWESLCTYVGRNAPESLPALIEDTEAIVAILSNRGAVEFMVKQCTGDFMVSFMESADCLAALEESPYKELVYANEHWAKFLAMVA